LRIRDIPTYFSYSYSSLLLPKFIVASILLILLPVRSWSQV
jgi:hypothetical protein